MYKMFEENNQSKVFWRLVSHHHQKLCWYSFSTKYRLLTMLEGVVLLRHSHPFGLLFSKLDVCPWRLLVFWSCWRRTWFVECGQQQCVKPGFGRYRRLGEIESNRHTLRERERGMWSEVATISTALLLSRGSGGSSSTCGASPPSNFLPIRAAGRKSASDFFISSINSWQFSLFPCRAESNLCRTAGWGSSLCNPLLPQLPSGPWFLNVQK